MSERGLTSANSTAAEPNPQAKDATVILVHGIWMQGPLMQLLAWHLRRYGYQTRCVSYRFLAQSPAENAAVLAAAVKDITTPTVHWAAHSLGGIVLLHYFHSLDTDSNKDVTTPDNPLGRTGRAVLIGSPVNGSHIAQRLHRTRIMRVFLGRSCDGGLLGGAPRSIGRYPVGLIRGTSDGPGRWLSVSYWLNRRSGASDGVVLHSETELAGAQAITEVPRTHTAMAFSALTARKAAEFFANGEFSNTG